MYVYQLSHYVEKYLNEPDDEKKNIYALIILLEIMLIRAHF